MKYFILNSQLFNYKKKSKFQENILNPNIKFMSLITKTVKCIKENQTAAVFTNLNYMRCCEQSFVNKQHITYFYILHFKNASVNNVIKRIVLKTLN